MIRIKPKYWIAGLLAVVVLVSLYYGFLHEPYSNGRFETERMDGGYYSFIDLQTEKEIDQTARVAYKGDMLILSDNSLYEVVDIKGDSAFCRFKGREELIWPGEGKPSFMSAQSVATGTTDTGIIALYNTHNAESFVPTSGTDSKRGDGDIFQVTQTIGDVIEEKGLSASISKNKHDPHDANAYHRSRRTAVALLKEGPVLMIDIHRDGVPDPASYATIIDGEDATHIRLVVGRQNPNMDANLAFAKSMKAYYDTLQPGFIKGIYLARGNYNQDLSPHAILIEVGTHTNSLEAAAKGATVYASLLPDFLGLTPKSEEVKTQNKGALRVILWMAVLLMAGSFGFLLISTGSTKEAIRKLKEFPKEFGFLKEKKK